jgi:cell division protein FtsI (penicillin-binding protein 3)
MKNSRRSARHVVIKESTGRRVIEQSRLRLVCVGMFFCLCFGSIGWRVGEIMLRPQAEKTTIAAAGVSDDEEDVQLALNSEAPPLQRGEIVDRNGSLIATSLRTASLFANPKEIRDPEQVAAKLEKVLPGVNAGQLAKGLNSAKSFIWVKRHLTPREEQAVNNLGYPGLYFLPEEKRLYPYGPLLAHVLGYVGVDNKGLAGIEKTLDRRLLDPLDNREPLQLSIDLRVQAIVHEELSAAVSSFHALGGVGVVMDVKTGELIAMVSLPDFDPNRPGQASDVARFNRASLGTYEMGSTFKSFTMALALDSGAATFHSSFDATSPLHFGGFTIDDDHPQRRWLTLPEVYAYSSNIGTAKIIQEVGGKRQQAFLKKLGLLSPLSVELPERAQPQYPSQWQDINTITISYGHGIAVTPLHLARAIAAITNGGTLPQVSLLKGGPEKKIEEQRVISEATSRNVRRLMRMVVLHGTGKKADVRGYRVGGKTGTAEKVTNGGYSHKSNLALFVSAFPVDAPRYAIVAMVDEPHGTAETYGFVTGGWVSAPVVSRIISRMAPLYGLPPVLNAPGDDAEQIWASITPPPKDKKQVASVPKPTPTPLAPAVMPAPSLASQYVHAVSY